jgi:hypothetical protein
MQLFLEMDRLIDDAVVFSQFERLCIEADTERGVVTARAEATLPGRVILTSDRPLIVLQNFDNFATEVDVDEQPSHRPPTHTRSH